MVFQMIHTAQVRLLARLIAPVGLLVLFSSAASAGVCQNKQMAFNRLSGQDAAILARLRAAGAANNCAGVMAAGSQRIALLRRVASMRPGVVNCEDATHKNSDRDPPGYDARQIALTQQVMSACRGSTVRTAAKPAPAAKPAAKRLSRIPPRLASPRGLRLSFSRKRFPHRHRPNRLSRALPLHPLLRRRRKR